MISCNAYFIFSVILGYYFIMDIVTYVILQNITLIDQSRNGSFSIFRPTTIKLLMSDQTNNYVMVLTAEYFDLWTGFSKEFPSVTPNMVSMIHIIIALIASKYISSDNLKDRRHGVIMFEIKTWLDGVIHRSHSNDPVYKSHKATLGYFVDGISDTISGIGISLGVLFFLFKTRHGNNKVRKTNLPADIENNIDNYENVHLQNVPENSKKSLIWICWCYGFQIAVASASWDKRIEGMEYVLQTGLKHKTQTVSRTKFIDTWV